MTKQKRKVVLASGAFDLLHYGHVQHLTEAKRMGGKNARLLVIVARDRTVERLKGEKPIFPEDQRRALVESLEVVNEAILGFENMDLTRVLKRVRPSIVALGYDEEKMELQLKQLINMEKLNIQVVRIEKFGEVELTSSSKIKRKIIENFKGNET